MADPSIENSQAAPATQASPVPTISKAEAAQIRVGMESMRRAIGGEDVHQACYRGKDGVAWVDFLYGSIGGGPPAFKGGWGIAKEKAKRTFEHQANPSDPSAARTLAVLPTVIVLGTATHLHPQNPREVDRVRLEYTVAGEHYLVFLVQNDKTANHWLLSGYEDRSKRTK